MKDDEQRSYGSALIIRYHTFRELFHLWITVQVQISTECAIGTGHLPWWLARPPRMAKQNFHSLILNISSLCFQICVNPNKKTRFPGGVGPQVLRPGDHHTFNQRIQNHMIHQTRVNPNIMSSDWVSKYPQIPFTAKGLKYQSLKMSYPSPVPDIYPMFVQTETW